MNLTKKALLSLSVLALALSSSTQAFAHTEVDSTSPNAGATVDAGVQTVSVSFTDKILDLADSSEIVIDDPNGKPVEVSCILVDKQALSVDAMIPTEGTYKVTWRTVAEDGHPITGKFEFQATGSSSDEFTSCTEAASETTVDEPTVIAEPKASAVDDIKEPSNDLVIYVIGGVVVISAAIGFVIRRNRRKN